METKKVVIVNADPHIMRSNVRKSEAGLCFICTVNESGAEEVIQQEHVDAVVYRISGDDKQLIGFLQRVKAYRPRLSTIVWTDIDLAPVYNHLTELGVVSFVKQSCNWTELIAVIHQTLKGHASIPVSLLKQLRLQEFKVALVEGKREEVFTINVREQLILSYLANGLTIRSIADKLYITQRALEYYLTALYKKMSVTGRNAAVRKAVQSQLLLPIAVDDREENLQ